MIYILVGSWPLWIHCIWCCLFGEILQTGGIGPTINYKTPAHSTWCLCHGKYKIPPRELIILEKENSEINDSCIYMPYYYNYSSPVCKNLSSKFDENLPARSQFDSDHRVDFSTPTSCQSATFVTAFCVCPFFPRQKSSKNHKCDESVSIGVIDEVLSANDDPKHSTAD